MGEQQLKDLQFAVIMIMRPGSPWTAGQTFSPPTTRTAPEFSHSLAG